MNYRVLGDTGLLVSEIGFGAWGIGGVASGSPAYGETDDQVSTGALLAAYDRGITFFDTADSYGDGHSERLIGRALREVRPYVVIATKVGYVGQDRQDFSVGHIRHSAEASLSRLATDYIDLYQLHSCPLDGIAGDACALGALEGLKAEGKIRAYGISLRSPFDGFSAVHDLRLRSVQVNFSLVDQRALRNGLLDLCHEMRTGVIVRTPLCFGFLTGAYGDAVFPATDHRSSWSREQQTLWADACRVFSSAVAAEHGQTPAQLALRFCLSYPAVSTVIPGMLSRAQVLENTAASELGLLPDSTLRQFEALYHQERFFIGSK